MSRGDNEQEPVDDEVDIDGLMEFAVQAQLLPGVSIERDVPAGQFCTYRVGGPLRMVATVENPEALGSFTQLLEKNEVACLPIGKGSNLLVAEAGFDGVAIVLGDGFSHISIDGTTLTVGASASLPVVARATVKAGLTGFEWAVGVPGSIGGAVRMNAGGHGSDMAANLVAVDLADVSFGGIVTRPAATLELGYRTSNIARWQIVANAVIELSEASEDIDGEEVLREIVAWRRAKQPGGANAGSVFTNPPDDSAGRLIDEAGLKAHRVGSAEVSEKHANFIQVDADGSADDVMALMVELVDRVEATSGVHLHAETRLIGFAQDLVDHVQAAPSRGGE